jgi:hypothetical protein
MIAAGYLMDVYCDSEAECKSKTADWQPPARDSFYGQTWSEVCRMARSKGWKITRDGQYAYCPACNRKKGTKA